MSLPARQQHALQEIELRLQAGDPRLQSMFATFTRLTSREAMPPTEAIRTRLSQAALLIGLIAAAVLGAVALALLTPTPSCSRAPSARLAAHAAPAWTSVCPGHPSADPP